MIGPISISVRVVAVAGAKDKSANLRRRNAKLAASIRTKHSMGWDGVGVTERRREPVPTAAAPGTEAKLQVLEARALAGENLFHPLDRLLGLDY